MIKNIIIAKNTLTKILINTAVFNLNFLNNIFLRIIAPSKGNTGIKFTNPITKLTIINLSKISTVNIFLITKNKIPINILDKLPTKYTISSLLIHFFSLKYISKPKNETLKFTILTPLIFKNTICANSCIQIAKTENKTYSIFFIKITQYKIIKMNFNIL